MKNYVSLQPTHQLRPNKQRTKHFFFFLLFFFFNMETIHQTKNRAWIDNNVINIREFIEKWRVNEKNMGSNKKKNDQANSLTEYECRAGALRCDAEVELNLPDGNNLKTLQYQKAELLKRSLDPKYLTAHYANMKFSNYPPQKIPKIDCKNSHEFKPIDIDGPEVILTVQIHAPERRLDAKVVNYMKMPSFHVEQEFLVLGCQYLTELREVIDCISDKAVPGDFSDCPHVIPTITCKDIYKSGFFYINGVFYNDMRDKDCRDYSENIIQWSKNRGIGPFKKAFMEETRFVDLTLQLGYPYLYVHQGECEHLIIFTDLRLFSKHDNNNRNAYPMYTQVKPSKRIFCMVCHAYTAVWVVYDNKRLPENPYFFCKTCFFSFNYDENDKKIGDFKAFHYPDRSRLC